MVSKEPMIPEAWARWAVEKERSVFLGDLTDSEWARLKREAAEACAPRFSKERQKKQKEILRKWAESDGLAYSVLAVPGIKPKSICGNRSGNTEDDATCSKSKGHDGKHAGGVRGCTIEWAAKSKSKLKEAMEKWPSNILVSPTPVIPMVKSRRKRKK